MGILVHSGTLPDGNVVSNVYMSFTPETVHCFPYNGEAYNYIVRYNVHRKNPHYETGNLAPPFGNFVLTIKVQDPSKEGPWTTCYNALKELYPDSDDVLESKTPLTPEEIYSLGLL
jgi:hypothetical protein